MALAYVAFTTMDRSRVAGQMARFPEQRRETSLYAGIDSFFHSWIATITLPSIAVGGVISSTGFAAYMRQQTRALPPAVAKWGPTGVAAALLPLFMPASFRAADYVMDWVFRPTLASWIIESPTDRGARPGSDRERRPSPAGGDRPAPSARLRASRGTHAAARSLHRR